MGESAKKALVTGITGQDGSYLAEFLLDKGYEVHGIIRRSSTFNTDRIDHLYRDPHETGVRLFNCITAISPTRWPEPPPRQARSPTRSTTSARRATCGSRFDIPDYTADVTGVGTLRLLEAMREAGVARRASTRPPHRRCSASAPPPQSEATPFHPRSPYGVAKVAAFWSTVNYREAYGMFAVNGILFNHESPRRGETFVTRKITRAVARIKAGLQDKLYLGNLDARRDWGYAPDYVEAMWRMLQARRARRLRRRDRRAAHRAGVLSSSPSRTSDLDWKAHVEIDPRYFRPTEVDALLGDATKAASSLAGSRRSASRSWCGSWSTRTCRRSRTSSQARSPDTVTS